MKLLKCICFLLTICLLFAVGNGCFVNSPKSLSDSGLGQQEMETQRAFQQLKEADLVIEFQPQGGIVLGILYNNPYNLVWLSDISEIKTKELVGNSGNRHTKVIPEDQLLHAVQLATPNRNLVVVDLWSPAVMSDKQFKVRVDGIENKLKSIGFKKIVFHILSSFGRSVYRE